MSDGAFVTTLPAYFATLREGVEKHVPETAVNAIIRKGLITLLGWAEAMAHALVSITPTPLQQRFHAPLGDRSPVVEEPRVPRHSGRDPRLPGSRPHP
ncbi:hypothetical protein CIW48_19300 [Methylobacterium sp. P1-11]|uniref:hypothetical protein n=1 Tax=Methylobacterium sp. P1-11 TaxID=2024616 RepID=UPI0011EE4890|nr:hypothetical protein [Methylobacterium sp. P1-11]KAA0122148.1 hypothetical protein CIW48_19300 [Methylobacterium sp. P1-11]